MIMNYLPVNKLKKSSVLIKYKRVENVFVILHRTHTKALWRIS